LEKAGDVVLPAFLFWVLWKLCKIFSLPYCIPKYIISMLKVNIVLYLSIEVMKGKKCFIRTKLLWCKCKSYIFLESSGQIRELEDIENNTCQITEIFGINGRFLLF